MSSTPEGGRRSTLDKRNPLQPNSTSCGIQPAHISLTARRQRHARHRKPATDHTKERPELDHSGRSFPCHLTEIGHISVERQVEHYNIDMILSVGYRVKSAEGVHFRRWASDVLRRYVLQGSALNERRLQELGSIVQVLSRSSDELVAGVAEVVDRYLPSLRTLRDYDNGKIDESPGTAPTWQLTYEEARSVIDQVAAEFPADTLFGGERGGSLRGVIATIYQGFGGVELYPTVQSKAANLLYLVIKDHPLTDGNKRSAAALFVHFLERNGVLAGPGGISRISNNALAAITLMVAMSDPKEKELMIALVVSMLADEGQ